MGVLKLLSCLRLVVSLNLNLKTEREFLFFSIRSCVNAEENPFIDLTLLNLNLTNPFRHDTKGNKNCFEFTIVCYFELQNSYGLFTIAMHF